MSDSTTQPIKEAAAAESNFSRELHKKIRNKNKKIQQIKDAETKIKAEGKQPTPQHLTKLASIPQLEQDIIEFINYLDLFNQYVSEQEKKEAATRKQHAKELGQARKAAVTNIANMITMHTLQDCGQKISDDVEEGVAHFRENINRLTLRAEQSANWRVSRDSFISEWTRLCQNSQDIIQHTETSYEDLATGVVEAISSGGYPEEISKPKKERKAKKSEPKEAEPEVVEEKVEAPVEEAPVEEVVEPEPAAAEEQAPVEESSPPVEEEPAAQEEAPAQEEKTAGEADASEPLAPPKSDSKPAEEEKQDAPAETNVRSRGQKRERGERPERRGRGDFERRGRGDAERRGRGDRPDRGDRRGRGRGRGSNYVKRPYGEDAEGFTIVKDDNEPTWRGRGRGRGGYYRGDRGDFRGKRGDRGDFRGDRGDRGNYRGDRGDRGDRRGRGERPQRKGQEFAEGKQINEKQEKQPDTPAENNE